MTTANKEPFQPLEPLEVVKALNALAKRINPESTLDSFTKLTIAFGMLLDVYANPNAANPKGMMGGDEFHFRLYFCKILAAPTSQKLKALLEEGGFGNEKTN